MSYDQIAQVLRKLESRFGWQPIVEDGRIIGVLLDGQSVTLEPGGQFELSGAPVETIHRTCAEVNSHLYQVGWDSGWGQGCELPTAGGRGPSRVEGFTRVHVATPVGQDARFSAMWFVIWALLLAAHAPALA